MKGPAGRLKFVIKRVWECQVCQKREFTGGDVVSRLCACLAMSNPPQQTWMKLIEEPRERPKPVAPALAVDTEAPPQTTQSAPDQAAVATNPSHDSVPEEAK